MTSLALIFGRYVFTLFGSTSSSSSASNDFYTKPSGLSVFETNTLFRIEVKVWDEIPQALRNLSKSAFKRELKDVRAQKFPRTDFF